MEDEVWDGKFVLLKLLSVLEHLLIIYQPGVAGAGLQTLL